MQLPLCLVIVLVSALFGLPQISAAQSVASPAIQSVTLQPDTGVLTITGTGLGANLIVTVDGQSVTALPGATATRLEVQSPATVLTTPGTYRLVVVDPVRRVGDGFVVASQGSLAGGIIETNGTASTSAGGRASSSGALARARMTAVEVSAPAASAPNGPSPMTVIEDQGFPYRTALGYGALGSNTTGQGNTAVGWSALNFNTVGEFNTASGLWALSINSSGSFNTANGFEALTFNTTGASNTASGSSSLRSNSTGTRNTASGARALYFSTTGSSNTANGIEALYGNSTGSANTASGDQALYSNTTGFYNAANGYRALYSNTSGFENTATGTLALASTTGDDNTATGANALFNNATGSNNTADGAYALYFTTGFDNTAVGYGAGVNATTGSYNVFLGSQVSGNAADTNTIRIGLPYSGANGQNRTFIAGIFGTPLTGAAYNVYIDANGQLGTAPMTGGGGFLPMAQSERQIGDLREQLRDQHDVITDLRARLAKLEALMAAAARRK
jgi:hypothetical protein